MIQKESFHPEVTYRTLSFLRSFFFFQAWQNILLIGDKAENVIPEIKDLLPNNMSCIINTVNMGKLYYFFRKFNVS